MRRFARDCAGSVQIEYVLIGGLIALVLISAVTATGQHVNGILTTAAAALAR